MADKTCPQCGGKMIYLQVGYHWDGTPAMRWRCVSGRQLGGTVNAQCYCEIMDGDPPWSVTLYTMGLLCEYLAKYHALPFESQRPPEENWCVQPRLF